MFFYRPVRGVSGTDWRLTQGFGERPDFYKPMGFAGHMGLDYAGPKPGNKIPVFASCGGKCSVYLDTSPKKNVGYGNYVTILTTIDGKEYQILYGHLDSISVKNGQVVKPFEQIGIMGTTGNSSAVHLHWEVKDPTLMTNGYKGRFDPAPFVKDWDYIDVGSLSDIEKAWNNLPAEAKGFGKYDDTRLITAREARMVADIRYWRGGPQNPGIKK